MIAFFDIKMTNLSFYQDKICQINPLNKNLKKNDNLCHNAFVCVSFGLVYFISYYIYGVYEWLIGFYLFFNNFWH